MNKEQVACGVAVLVAALVAVCQCDPAGGMLWPCCCEKGSYCFNLHIASAGCMICRGEAFGCDCGECSCFSRPRQNERKQDNDFLDVLLRTGLRGKRSTDVER